MGGVLYSEVQCIMGNGHMGIPLWIDRHTPVKTLPSRNFVDGSKKVATYSVFKTRATIMFKNVLMYRDKEAMPPLLISILILSV